MLSLLLVCLASSAAGAPRPADLLARLDDAKIRNQEFEQIIADAYGVASASKLSGVQVAFISPVVAGDKHFVAVFPETQTAFPAASTVKVVLAALAARNAAHASAGWNAKFRGSTLIAVTRKMIRTSDNPSANQLLLGVGFPKLHSWLGALGFAPGEFSFSREFGDFDAPGDNTCTAFALAKFYFLLAQPEAVDNFADKASLSKLRALLDSQGDCNNVPQFNDRLNARLSGVSFIHKTGSNNDVLADGGIFRGSQNDFILVVLDRTKDKAAMQRLGEAMYKRFNEDT